MTHDFTASALAQLKKAGYRITQARRSLLEVLSETKRPLHAAEIHELLEENKQAIDLVSVYRILEVLLDLGLVHRDLDEQGFFPCAHCPDCPEHTHVVLKCTDCHQIRELDYHGEIFSKGFYGQLSKLHSTLKSKMVFLSEQCQACAA